MPTLRFVQRDSVDDLSPSLVSTEPHEGASLAHVLVRLGRTDASGVLGIKRDDGLEAVFGLLKGVLHRVSAKGYDDDALLTAHFRARPEVDHGRLDAAIATATAERKPLSLSLFRAGLAPVQEIARVLREGRSELLRAVLAPGEGQVTFQARNDVPRDPITIPLTQALFAHYRGRLDGTMLKDLEPRLGNHVVRFPLATFETPMFLNGTENQLVEQYCTGNLNSRTVIDKGNLGPMRGARLLLLLYAFELLDARAEPLRIAQNLDVKEAVDGRMPSVEAGNHFGVLDVHWTSHPLEIEAKYHEEVKRFDDFLTREGLSDELAADLRLLRLSIDEAWRVLKDPARRHELRARLYTRQQIEFAASFLHQQSELSVFRLDERSARRQLESALELTGDRRYMEALTTLRARIHGDRLQPAPDDRKPPRT